jgi:NADH:ubiquinone oxidoreductase subunit D
MYSIVGDAFDRFINRVFDMRNSIIIIKQCLTYFITGYTSLFNSFNVDFTIETIIYIFYMCWCICIPGISSCSVEHPKGEYCCTLSLFTFTCSRCRIRCSDYLQID